MHKEYQKKLQKKLTIDLNKVLKNQDIKEDY